MNIKINNTAHTFVFGYGFLRKFGEFYEQKSYQDTINFIEQKLGKLEDMTFEQEDVLKNFFYFAAVNGNCKNADALQDLDIVPFITQEVDTLSHIFEGFRASFPQNEGKPQPRKTARKTKRK